MATSQDMEYRKKEDCFIVELAKDLREMVKQDSRELYFYVARKIAGVLQSPDWNIYDVATELPEGVNRSQAEHIWQTIAERVTGFCAATEGKNIGREQADWILLRLFKEISQVAPTHGMLSVAISGRVIIARLRQTGNPIPT